MKKTSIYDIFNLFELAKPITKIKYLTKHEKPLNKKQLIETIRKDFENNNRKYAFSIRGILTELGYEEKFVEDAINSAFWGKVDLNEAGEFLKKRRESIKKNK